MHVACYCLYAKNTLQDSDIGTVAAAFLILNEKAAFVKKKAGREVCK
jgi:hypothetical protein